ncbi:major capsid protein [Microvirus sp.]|nr:major capsid protein [Microvirus sp.]
MKRGFLFNSVPAPKVGTSVFDLSHEHKLTCAMGQIVPVGVFEQIPGDIFTIKPSALIRTQALISPLMHRVDVSMNAFEVPYRILWDSFEDFITGGEDGLAAPEMPYFTLSQIRERLYNNYQYLNEEFGFGSLLDYMGVPLPTKRNAQGVVVVDWSLPNEAAYNVRISALPFRAYYKIWYDYFRDQNINYRTNSTLFEPQEIIKPQTYSGKLTIKELASIFGLNHGKPYLRAWKKDYFTSALPDSQRGPEVKIPFSGSAPVNGSLDEGDVTFKANPTTAPQSATTLYGKVVSGKDNEINVYTNQNAQLNTAVSAVVSNKSVSGTVDLTEVSAVGIIALRNAFKLQQFLERNNVAGGRYIESILAHFGVLSPDRRLQRPAYLGGFSQPIQISEIETNANSNGETDNVVGDLAGKGKAFGNFGKYSCMATEHGCVMVFMSIMPTAAYGQGLPRMFTRMEKFDFAFPEFQNIGEQSIKNQEIYMYQSNPGGDFGYTPRYAEYKYLPDRFSGDMLGSLEYWHMGRSFDSAPTLSQSFIECHPTDRIFAVQDQVSSQHIVADIWLDFKAIRKLQKYSLPGLS